MALIKIKIISFFVHLLSFATKANAALLLENYKHAVVNPHQTCQDVDCDSIAVRFEAFRQYFDVSVLRNKELLSTEYFEEVNGRIFRPFDARGLQKHCHYSASSDSSWAAISSCDETFEGIFEQNHQVFHLHFNEKLKEHHLYRDQDLPASGSKCGVTSDGPKIPKDWPLIQSNSTQQRSKGTKKGPQFIELLLVNDVSFGKQFTSSAERVKYNMQVANLLNTRFKTLKLHVVLLGIISWSEDKIETSTDASAFVFGFAKFAYKEYFSKHGYDSAHLFTSVLMDEGVAGIALVQQVCGPFSVGVDSSTSMLSKDLELFSTFAATVVHEMGHNLGLDHDENYMRKGKTCSCSSGYDEGPQGKETKCIMSWRKKLFVVPTEWSSCSKDHFNLSETIEHLAMCLGDKPIGSQPICGNGVVDTGEGCDCPQDDVPCKRCCDIKTCKLTTGSVCSSELCCKDCQLLTETNHVCRVAKNESCDFPESCDGKEVKCPADKRKPDGESCGSDQQCFKGNCFKISTEGPTNGPDEGSGSILLFLFLALIVCICICCCIGFCFIIYREMKNTPQDSPPSPSSPPASPDSGPGLGPAFASSPSPTLNPQMYPQHYPPLPQDNYNGNPQNFDQNYPQYDQNYPPPGYGHMDPYQSGQYPPPSGQSYIPPPAAQPTQLTTSSPSSTPSAPSPSSKQRLR